MNGSMQDDRPLGPTDGSSDDPSLPGGPTSGVQVCGFVALAFALSWGLWIPVLVSDPDAGQWTLLLGAFGPALAAAVMVCIRGGRVRSWLRDIAVFRAPASRYAMAVGMPVAWVGVQLVVAAATGIPVVFAELPMAALVFVAVFVLVALVGGGQEEFGWRGWLQPALQGHLSPLGASVVVGLVWAVWHLPLFWLYGAYEQTVVMFYVPTLVGLSVIIAHLWERSRHSVVIAIALHASFNASGGLFVVGGPATDPAVQFVAQGTLATTVVALAAVLAVRYGGGQRRPVPGSASPDRSVR